MSEFMDRIHRLTTGLGAQSSPSDKVDITNGALELSVYDVGNLVGFTLTGNVDGRSVYIVHDTDNYNKTRYKAMYQIVVADAEHVTSLFVNNQIKTEIIIKKTLFGKKEVLKVVIPDGAGRPVSYDALTVNTATFK